MRTATFGSLAERGEALRLSYRRRIEKTEGLFRGRETAPVIAPFAALTAAAISSRGALLLRALIDFESLANHAYRSRVERAGLRDGNIPSVQGMAMERERGGGQFGSGHGDVGAPVRAACGRVEDHFNVENLSFLGKQFPQTYVGNAGAEIFDVQSIIHIWGEAA